LREVGLEEEVDCLLSGGGSFVIFFRMMVVVALAGLLMRWGVELVTVKIHLFGVILG
jgi:hypothetical protein